MPQVKSSSLKKTSTSSRRSSREKNKFLPNLTQVNEAAKELPEPEIWPESTYKSPVEVDGKQQIIEFALKNIQRGTQRTPRWVYEGKVLIRKRDTGDSDRSSRKPKK